MGNSLGAGKIDKRDVIPAKAGISGRVGAKGRAALHLRRRLLVLRCQPSLA
jgi:hypothetical protein